MALQEESSKNDGPGPNVHSAALPPLRTFLVRRQAAGAEARPEDLLVLAHTIQISFNVLIFEMLSYRGQTGELTSQVHRAFHAWADVEEILTPASQLVQ